MKLCECFRFGCLCSTCFVLSVCGNACVHLVVVHGVFLVGRARQVFEGKVKSTFLHIAEQSDTEYYPSASWNCQSGRVMWVGGQVGCLWWCHCGLCRLPVVRCWFAPERGRCKPSRYASARNVGHQRSGPRHPRHRFLHGTSYFQLVPSCPSP